MKEKSQEESTMINFGGKRDTSVNEIKLYKDYN